MVGNVLLLETSKISNVGNAFLSKGAEATLQRAFPDSNIISISLYSDYLAHRLHKRSNVINSTQQYAYDENDFRDNFVDMVGFLEIDLLVVPGCILDRHGLEKYLVTLHSAAKKNIPILFLGVGGSDYEDSTVEYVKSRLSDLSVTGIITRDSTAYNLYSELAEESYDGIDNAFFIDDWYNPPKISKNFIASTFDKSEGPHLDSSKTIIRPNHAPINWFQQSGIKSIVPLLKDGAKNLSENTFVSDDPKDYLLIYANADETHSDRVHACIPALVYGNKAKFYHKTPRAELFDKFFENNETIKEKPIKLNLNLTNRLKNKQVKAVEGFGETLLE